MSELNEDRRSVLKNLNSIVFVCVLFHLLPVFIGKLKVSEAIPTFKAGKAFGNSYILI